MQIAKYTGKHGSIANAKANFHLDYVYALRRNGSDWGFIGMVLEGSTNAGWRASSRLSASRIRRGSTIYRMLTDAGLNLKPEVNIIVLSRYANWVVFRLSIKVPPYNAVSSSSATMSYFGQTVSLGGSSSVDTTITKTATFTHSTPGVGRHHNHQDRHVHALHAGYAVRGELKQVSEELLLRLLRYGHQRRGQRHRQHVVRIARQGGLPEKVRADVHIGA